VAGQAIGGDAVAEHAARLSERLKHGHRVAPAHHLIGAGKAGGSRPDDRDLFPVVFLGEGLQRETFFQSEAPDKALQAVDGCRRVQVVPVAGGFAEMGADPATDRRERVPLRDNVERLFEGLLGGFTEGLGLGDGGEDGPDVRVVRAGV